MYWGAFGAARRDAAPRGPDAQAREAAEAGCRAEYDRAPGGTAGHDPTLRDEIAAGHGGWREAFERAQREATAGDPELLRRDAAYDRAHDDAYGAAFDELDRCVSIQLDPRPADHRVPTLHAYIGALLTAAAALSRTLDALREDTDAAA